MLEHVTVFILSALVTIVICVLWIPFYLVAPLYARGWEVPRANTNTGWVTVLLAWAAIASTACVIWVVARSDSDSFLVNGLTSDDIQ
jgi:hypothetical protein